jgi:hypothetical protein
MLRASSGAIIVLDALDEFPEPMRRSDLAPFLQNFICKNIDGVRVLATSRREPDIQRLMATLASHSINLHYADQHASDLSHYISHELSQPEFLGWPVKTKAIAEEVLNSRANGM